MNYYEYNSNDPNYYQEYVDIILTQNLSFTCFYLGQGCSLYIRNNNGKLEQFGVGETYNDVDKKKEHENLLSFTNGYTHLKKVTGKIVNFNKYIKLNHPELYEITSLL